MGKGKAKKTAPTATGEEFFQSSDGPCCKCNHEHPRAADGHNVDGWTDEDIRIYNELLTERAKLEKEKNELEQKSARHQAERALLNEDAAAFDKLFKAELGGEYKFIGKAACCLDFSNDSSTASQLAASNNICHHEVCSRAKTQGVSWMEMDTIKYYQARITSERSQRMKNALRKQRDVELARVKKEDEEENALRNRRSALSERSSASEGPLSNADGHDSSEFSLLDAIGSKESILSPKDNAILEAAKENELVVKKIRSRLDKIRYDVHAGRVSASDARMKLDQTNKEMAEAERKNNTFKEMIFTAGASQDNLLATSSSASASLSRALTKSLAASSGDAFSQALTVMKGFFSASDPRDVQAAISDLRTVLEVNGPMSPVLQKSFQALEDMLARPNAKGFSVDLTGSDGTTRTATNVVEVLLMLRNPKDRAALTSTAKELKLDETTLKANEECMKIEDAAGRNMETATTPFKLSDFKTYYEKLKEIRNKASMKAPIPPLSDIVLQERMEAILYSRTMTALYERCSQGATQQELTATITSIVIHLAERKVDLFMPTLGRLELEAGRVHPETKMQEQGVAQALKTVKASMGASVAKHQIEKQHNQTKSTSRAEDSSRRLIPDPLQLKKTMSPDSKANTIRPADFAKLPPDAQRFAASIADLPAAAAAALTPEAIVNALIADEPDSPENRQLQQDLQKYLSTPKCHEETHLKERIERRVNHLADLHAQRRAQEKVKKDKEAKAKAKGHTSKFQEELTTGDEPSPPPYSANEGRARTVKVKQVPVSTPHVQDRSAEQSKSPRSQTAESLPNSTTIEQKAADVSQNLQKMRRDLQALTRLPGLEGARATKLRRQLDSVMNQMDDFKFEESQAYAASVDSNKGKGKEKMIIQEPKAQAAAQEETARNNKKKRNKRSTVTLSEAAPSPDTATIPMDPLSEREDVIRSQLLAMQTNLRTLSATPVPSSATEYGIPVAFDGITGRLQAQLNGHVETALMLCEVNEWSGLKIWIKKAFQGTSGVP